MDAVLDRLLGLYLSVTYVTMVVVSLHLWRRRGRVLALALLIAPIAIWVLWAIAGRLPDFRRAHLGIGLLAALPALPLLPLAWLISIAPGAGDEGAFERTLGVASALLSPRRATGVLLWMLCVGCALWYAYGLVALEDTCPMDEVIGAVRASPVDLRRGAVCVSSAAGLWPIALASTIVTASALARRSGPSRPQGRP